MNHLNKLFIAIILISGYILTAQVSITNDSSSADGSAILDVKSIDKGLLIPQIALTGVNDATTILTPVTSLLIYNTVPAEGICPGYYYNSGTSAEPVWKRLATGFTDGSETKLEAGTNAIISGTGTLIDPYAINQASVGNDFTHYIGEPYQGGIVISVWKENGVEHGLIASLTDLSDGKLEWTTPDFCSTTVPGDALSEIDGMENSNKIVAQAGLGDTYAAGLCRLYSSPGDGGLNDWYLPAIWELSKCFQAAIIVNSIVGSEDGFQFGESYWSSSEENSDKSWRILFHFQNEWDVPKCRKARVRAVRRF